MGFRMSGTADRRELASAHLGRLLLHAHRRVQVDSIAKLQQRGHTDVRTGHIPVFSNVDKDGTRITDLAARAGMTRQMMGRLVRELEALGYATSRSDPADQRAIVVALTDDGWRFCDDAQEVMTELEREYAELLGRDGLRRLREGLIRLTLSAPGA
jgi:DNA-binding MarR family transcriptional regulator